MAVIQISRIQHRRGLEQDFPQLASAELGWSLDTRRLFIGNGTLLEGAPTEGSTEILTEYTDILNLLRTYTYKGEAGGTTVQTGPSALSPIVRTFQEKLDDVVSVRDFGATGDGSTNDTAAINRALTNLWPTENFDSAYQQHRTLYFPAGVYVIAGDFIRIPPYVKLVGDGDGSTRFKQIDNAQPCVARLVDGYYQSGTAYGTPDASTSINPATSNYSINNIVFERIHDDDAIIIDGGSNISFYNCVFIAAPSGVTINDVPTTNVVSDLIYCLGRSYNDSYPIKNLTFNSCSFMNGGSGLRVESQTYGLSIMNSYFDNLFQGVVIGETSGSLDSPATTLYPYGITLTNNYFDGVARQAIRSYPNCSQILSIGNLFENVGYGGYQFDDSQPALSTIIEWESSDNISNSDHFKRPANDRQVFSVIEDNGFSCYYLEASAGYQLGRLVQQPGTRATLINNTTTGTPVTNQFSSNVNLFTPATVFYTIDRNGVNRTGTMRINFQSGATVVYDDEYSEFSDIGVTLSANIFSPVSPIILYYTTTNTGINANLIYDIKYHTANNAPF